MTHDNPERDEKIGRLIAAAGPGETARPEARERIHAAVRARWQESLQRPGAQAAPASFRAGRTGTSRFRLFGLAATIAAAAVLLYWTGVGGPGETARAELAQLARIQGDASLIRDAETLRLASAEAAGPVMTGDVLRTAGNGQVALELDDGLLLRVNVDTELAFVEAGAIDLVAGTVYVDSGEPAGGAALAIRTPLGSVTHLGTQYEVRFADRALRLRVREGSVRFSGAGSPAVGIAGEQLDIDAGGGSARSAIAADDAAWSWAVALATLPEQPEYRIGETLRWIAREQGLTLDFADPLARERLEAEPIFGLGGLTPAETLEVLDSTTDLELSVADGRLLVAD
jgi:ferric-dicitrate binding protein FerR (iron transport regulator)